MIVYVIQEIGGNENSPDSLNMIINKYFPGEPVYIYTIINKYFAGEKLGNYRQKRVRVNFHYFVIMENG